MTRQLTKPNKKITWKRELLGLVLVLAGLSYLRADLFYAAFLWVMRGSEAAVAFERAVDVMHSCNHHPCSWIGSVIPPSDGVKVWEVGFPVGHVKYCACGAGCELPNELWVSVDMTSGTASFLGEGGNGCYRMIVRQLNTLNKEQPVRNRAS